MKSRIVGAAISVSFALSPLVASAGEVDCGGPTESTCDLPGNTTITDNTAPVVSLTLDNLTTQWVIAGDNGGFGLGQTLGDLPFIIIDGAPGDSLWIGGGGNVGINAPNPTAPLEVRRANGTARLLVHENAVVANPLAPQTMFEMRRDGAIRFDLVDESNGSTWVFQNRNGAFDITLAGTGEQEFKLDGSGNLTIRGALTQQSDINSKEGFQALDGSNVLADIGRLEITKWRYKDDPDGYQHIGPTAQDFHAVFNVGIDDKSIAPLDVASVAVAGVKELNSIVTDQKVQLAQKDAELAVMQERMAELEDKVERLLMSLQHASL